MYARFAFAMRFFLSLAIVFVLSGFIMRYVTFGNHPELDRSKLLNEFADTEELAEKTVSVLRQFPDFLITGTQSPKKEVPLTSLLPAPDRDADIPVVLPLTQPSEHRISSPLPAATASAAEMRQVLGTASAGIAD